MVNNRRKFIKNSIGVTALAGLGACTSTDTNGKSIGGNFVHMVLFWMHNPSDEAEKTTFKKNLVTFLENVDVIRSYHVGTPAMTPRDVVDNSYTFSLVVTFDDVAGHDIYQEHPVHKKFIEDTKHLWSRVQIFDALNTL